MRACVYVIYIYVYTYINIYIHIYVYTYIPETFVKTIPLQSTGFVFIMLCRVVSSAESCPADGFGSKINSRSNSGILLHVPNGVRTTSCWRNTRVLGAENGERVFSGDAERNEVRSRGPLPLQGSADLLKPKQWGGKHKRGPTYLKKTSLFFFSLNFK